MKIGQSHGIFSEEITNDKRDKKMLRGSEITIFIVITQKDSIEHYNILSKSQNH
jgi:hypothetical protein